jgi:hypothetical protein
MLSYERDTSKYMAVTFILYACPALAPRPLPHDLKVGESRQSALPSDGLYRRSP